MEYVRGAYSFAGASSANAEDLLAYAWNTFKSNSKHRIIDVLGSKSGTHHITGYLYAGGAYGHLVMQPLGTSALYFLRKYDGTSSTGVYSPNVTRDASKNNLSSYNSLSSIFATLRSDPLGTGFGEVGTQQGTNLRTLLGNPSIGNYVRCNMQLINNTAIMCIAVSQASADAPKIKYLYHAEYSGSESYYHQTEWKAL